jgi:hypothetical protein
MANDIDINDAFAQRVLGLANSAPWSGPKVFFNPDGDCIELLLSNESYRARRLDALVTVYENRENGELVGALVKGVRGFVGEIVKRFPGFKIEIMDGKVKLEYLFAASLWKDDVSADRTLVKTYQKLREAAEQASLEVELEAV